ncbi:hypothetical protein L7F22_019012 [Adiantum nelumboides]|nr:hypothetical protein [Adiantum nelumboides]
MAPKRLASKREESTDKIEDADERALDPTLTDKPDVSDAEMARPAKKRKQSYDKAQSVKQSDHLDYSYSDTVGHDGKGKPPKRNAFNPTGKLPEKPTPIETLRETMKNQGEAEGNPKNVLYWMRMRDHRIEDNRALAKASQIAQSNQNSRLIALFIISPEDYRSHDRSPRRIDFTLRNLQWDVNRLFGNIEYEVDELWRDIQVLEKGKKESIHSTFIDDTYVVPPGQVNTKDGRPYSVFSPWSRVWMDIVAKQTEMLEEAPEPKPNDGSIKKDENLKGLFGSKIPKYVEGFECKDGEYMQKLWPSGSKSAEQVLENFIKEKGGLHVLDAPANNFTLDEKGSNTNGNGKESRIERYQTGRNLMHENGSSRISPYLTAGVISARACMRRVKEMTNNRLKVGRDSGPAAYNMEIGFRDFYGHVLAAWPRVCMGRAYITKYEDVVWEYDQTTLNAWKNGKTGYPIVDASMRQGAKQGYMHNRGRMIVAMFLTKHLMHDWREGESWFMQNFIDGDFASNNGGWQWSASTGTDPQPYFRIFNPLSQSEKCDPTGDYIRHWVPELRNIKGNAIHAPHERLPKQEFKNLNYQNQLLNIGLHVKGHLIDSRI